MPQFLRAAGFFLLVLGLAPGFAHAAYDIVVAQDGSGDFTNVQDAILAVPDGKTTRTTIFVAAGTYREKLTVPGGKNLITLVGENRATTILTYDDHASFQADGALVGTGTSWSVYVQGDDFAGRNLTFSNTSDTLTPAIAVYLTGDRAHFRNCAFLGYQDTLYTAGDQAYFKRCEIDGAIDFIFGDSTAVFQQCTIRCTGDGYITAADTSPDRAYGYVFKGCTIHGTSPAGTVYLGRAWGDHADVVYLHCDMDDEITSAGWYDWGKTDAHDTLFFGEYRSTGAGGNASGRVTWSHQLTADDLGAYTLGKIFALPTTPADATGQKTATPWYADF